MSYTIDDVIKAANAARLISEVKGDGRCGYIDYPIWDKAQLDRAWGLIEPLLPGITKEELEELLADYWLGTGRKKLGLKLGSPIFIPTKTLRLI